MTTTRWSIVNSLYVCHVSRASIVQVGDNEVIAPKVRILEMAGGASYNSHEESFAYPVFQREIPRLEATEEWHMFIDNRDSVIQVGSVRVTAISGSSVMQVGQNGKIEAESRIKHFR